MRRIFMLPVGFALLFSTACTNTLYQGEIPALDAYGKERRFILYWTKTDPLIGEIKAGPAVLLTECSPTRVDFTDQAEGIVFRGEPGFDRLSGAATSVEPGQVCGRIMGHAALSEAGAGPLSVRIDCQPMPPDDFALRPRNYLAARSGPYFFPLAEKVKTWSLLGKTLEAPPVPECREH